MNLITRIGLLLFLFNISAWSQKHNNMIEVKYVMDPYCGWCYGNSENISWLKEQLQERANIEIMVGGMWLGANAPVGGEELNHFIKTHSPRMEKVTGAVVGQGFYNLVNNPEYTFSSLEPSAAIVLVKQLAPEKSLQFAKEVQKAIFLNGNPLDKLESYIPVLKQLNIDEMQFSNMWMKPDNIKATEAEFDASGSLARSYPTLLVEVDGEIIPFVSGYFNKNEVLAKVEELIKQ